MLRVLVIGNPAAASDALRFEAFVPLLAQREISLGFWPSSDPAGTATDPFDTLGEALATADVLVLRRSYVTVDRCLTCGAAGMAAEMADHPRDHEVIAAPFGPVRQLVDLLEADRAALGHLGVVYDTDDDLLSADTAAPGGRDWLEADLVRRMIAVADTVTVATPVLAGRLADVSAGTPRVVRNALDPSWFAGDRETGLRGLPRVGYHGVATRVADYEIALPGILRARQRHPDLWRVWLGSDSDPRVLSVVDEARAWVPGPRRTAGALVAAGIDVGIAPLRDTRYNRARSELHWIEYALAGVPSVVTGFDGEGPYAPVRDGEDGLVAHEAAAWEAHIAALAGDPRLRARIGAAAWERARIAYSLQARAPEWDAVYRGVRGAG